MSKQLKDSKLAEFKHYCSLFKCPAFLGMKKNTKLFGQEKEMSIRFLNILKHYKEKFLGIRNSDIDAMMSDKNDREMSSSYAKHMKPTHKKEFENAYIFLCRSLNTDIFELEDFPTISHDGSVKYKSNEIEKKSIEKVEKVLEKKSVEKKIIIKSTMKDAWDDDEFTSPFMAKINLPKVVDGKVVMEQKLI
jgi:hypothetical protein